MKLKGASLFKLFLREINRLKAQQLNGLGIAGADYNPNAVDPDLDVATNLTEGQKI